MAPLTRLSEFLLVRLLAPTKRPAAPSRLREEMRRLLREPLDAGRWQSLVGELVEAGLLTPKPLRLTASGREHALAVLGLEELPERTTWRALRDRYLVPRALEIPEASGETRSRIGSQDGLGAWL